MTYRTERYAITIREGGRKRTNDVVGFRACGSPWAIHLNGHGHWTIDHVPTGTCLPATFDALADAKDVIADIVATGRKFHVKRLKPEDVAALQEVLA